MTAVIKQTVVIGVMFVILELMNIWHLTINMISQDTLYVNT